MTEWRRTINKMERMMLRRIFTEDWVPGGSIYCNCSSRESSMAMSQTHIGFDTTPCITMQYSQSHKYVKLGVSRVEDSIGILRIVEAVTSACLHTYNLNLYTQILARYDIVPLDETALGLNRTSALQDMGFGNSEDAAACIRDNIDKAYMKRRFTRDTRSSTRT